MTEEGKGEDEGAEKNGEEGAGREMRGEERRETGKCIPHTQGSCRIAETRTSKHR